MVRVTSTQEIDVQIAAQAFGKRAPEVFRQLD
jgi:hypothetical protein